MEPCGLNVTLAVSEEEAKELKPGMVCSERSEDGEVLGDITILISWL